MVLFLLEANSFQVPPSLKSLNTNTSHFYCNSFYYCITNHFRNWVPSNHNDHLLSHIVSMSKKFTSDEGSLSAPQHLVRDLKARSCSGHMSSYWHWPLHETSQNNWLHHIHMTVRCGLGFLTKQQLWEHASGRRYILFMT